ncbi:MAG: hypothetical protein QOI61_209 [Actinomycetota bacterium]|jgi:hypothetical protein
MLATRRTAVLAASAALAMSGCGSSDPVVKLDGSPRVPDTEGIVQKASVNGITLDGNRRYGVSKKLISFSTYNQKPAPLVSTIGSYVQVGMNGDTVVWLAKIGPVQADSSGHKTVQYQGDLVSVNGARLTFKDGTVLRLAKGLTPPADPLGPTYAVIDADKHVVQGATFAPARTKN